MATSTTDLLREREELLAQLRSIECFRRGTVNLSTRRCGKPGCRCAMEESAKHEYFLWSVSTGGKTVSKHLHSGPEVQKYLEETDRYRKFKLLVDRLTLVNEQLADAQPVVAIADADALDALKKKLRTKLSRSSRRNSAASSS